MMEWITPQDCVGQFKRVFVMLQKSSHLSKDRERYDISPFEARIKTAIAEWDETTQQAHLKLIQSLPWTQLLFESYLTVIEKLKIPFEDLTLTDLLELIEIHYWLLRILRDKPETPVVSDNKVYFILAEGIDRIKIGFSNDPVRRLRDFTTAGNPTPMKLLHTIPGGAREEGILHFKFAEHRLHGEWFRAQPVLEWLKSSGVVRDMPTKDKEPSGNSVATPTSEMFTSTPVATVTQDITHLTAGDVEWASAPPVPRSAADQTFIEQLQDTIDSLERANTCLEAEVNLWKDKHLSYLETENSQLTSLKASLASLEGQLTERDSEIIELKQHLKSALEHANIWKNRAEQALKIGEPLTDAQIAYGRDVVAPRIEARHAAETQPVVQSTEITDEEIDDWSNLV